MSWRQIQTYINAGNQWRGYGTVVNPPVGLGYIGDTLTAQGGSTEPKDKLVAAGFDTALVQVDAANSRAIAAASSVITGWRASGFDPSRYVIALGSYNLADSDATWTSAITTVLQTIGAGSGSYTVQWVGISLRDSVADTRATRFLSVLNSLRTIVPNVTLQPLDWNAYIHTGDQTGLWDAADTNQRLMTTAGYTWRNDYITALVDGSQPPDRPAAGLVPNSSFTADQTSGAVPLTVVFTDTSTGTPTAWSWDFGDGTTSTLQNPTKIYTVAGSYTVRLTAINAIGADPTPATTTITGGSVVNPGSWVFESSAVEGGGFQNAIAVSPFTTSTGRRPYLIGADVAGAHRSTDRGVNWVPCSVGSLSTSARVAAIMWSDITAGKAFLAEDGGIHRSTDFGMTWTKRTSVPDWDANNARGAPEHPRQTGYMLQQYTPGATKHYWCGTLTQGVKHSTDEFSTFDDTVLAGYPVRSIALDPNSPDTLYVAVNRGTSAQNGLWRITGARTAMVATKMTTYPGAVASPIGPEEVLAVDENGTTRIYVAGHESGMFRYTPSTSTWATINSGLTVNSSATYRAVCADPNTPTTVYCAHWHPASRRSIYRSTNSGGTWTQISAPTAGSIDVSYTVFGHSNLSFLKDIPYHSFSGPNADWLAAMLTIDPDVPSRVLAAGRGGAWFGTLSNGVRTWQPAVRGLMVTVMMAAEADHLVDGRVIFGNMDYTSLYTRDGADQNVYMTHNSGASSTGDAVTIDKSVTTGAGKLYVGSSTRGQSAGGGDVWSSTPTDPTVGGASTSWVNESAGAFTGDPVALGVGETSGGVRAIIVGVSGSGGWRKVGTTWAKMGTNAPFAGTGTNMGVIRWRRNSPVVYALDSTGLWRSNDAGGSWVKILGGVSSTYGTYDAIVLDPSNTAKLYLSAGGILRRIDNASTSSGTSATTVVTIWSSGGTAGNVAINPDGSEIFLNLRDGRLMRSTAFRTAASQAAASWTNIASTLFQNNTGNIRSMTCTPGGVILTADNGGGSWRGYRAT